MGCKLDASVLRRQDCSRGFIWALTCDCGCKLDALAAAAKLTFLAAAAKLTFLAAAANLMAAAAKLMAAAANLTPMEITSYVDFCWMDETEDYVQK